MSEAAANRHLSARAVSHARVRVLPNGVDTACFSPDPEARRRMRGELGLGNEFVWLAAGRLMWKKNYPLMLRAMAQRGGGVLLVAGNGPDRDELVALAEQLHVDARFLGSFSDMPALMNAADGFLLTSDVEGLPMALLEAAATGLPVVATAVGGVSDIVEDGVTGHLTTPGDLSGVADAIARMVDAPPVVRARMGAAARARAIEKFDIRVVARCWTELYRELLERSNGRD